MSKFQKLLLIQAVLVVFILGAIIQLILRNVQQSPPTDSNNQVITITPPFEKTLNGKYKQPQTQTEKEDVIEKVYEDTPRTSLATSLAVQKLALALDNDTFKTDSFEIGHSAMLGLFFVRFDQETGERDLRDYLSQNDLLDYYVDPQTSRYFVEVTGQDIARAKLTAEQKAIQYRRSHIQQDEQLLNYVPSKSSLSATTTRPRLLAAANGVGGATVLEAAPQDTETELRSVMDLLRSAMSFNFGKQGDTSIGAGSGGGGLNNDNLPSVTGTLPATTKVNQVFNQVGAKIGVPPKLVRAFMRVECGSALSAFDASDTLVDEYIKEGAKYTQSCEFNYECLDSYGYQDALLYCAQGLMQFMPGTWVGYANTVNENGYTRASTNPWNLLDATYAAAKKIKLDSGNTDPNNWTEQQIKDAQRAYFGASDGAYLEVLYEELNRWP